MFVCFVEQLPADVNTIAPSVLVRITSVSVVSTPHIPIDVFWRVHYLFDDGPATAALPPPSAAEVDVITSLGYPRLLPQEVANFVSWSNPPPQYRTESQPVLWTGFASLYLS